MAKDKTNLSDMLGLLASGIKNEKPNNYQYAPHRKQQIFHSSPKKGRLYIGGNRSGKTTGGINEDIWWLTRRHPYLRLPETKIMGRIITVDFKNGMHKIILPQLRQWLPPSDLINGSWEDSWSGALSTLTLANGSSVEIMSHEQELDKFAGVPRHFMHFDEECPQDIYKECLARLVDYNGHWWMTMTPVEGMTWTFDEIWEKKSDYVEIIEVAIDENPYLSQEAIDAMLDGYSDEERRIRARGEYVALSGLVFKFFDPEKHIIPPVAVANLQSGWKIYRSLDAGYNNPTAILWHAVHEETDTIVTFKEHYKSEMTVEQHASIVKQIDSELVAQGVYPFMGIADPAIKQRQQVTGHSIQIEYSLHGINWATGAVRSIDAGLDKMNNYMRLGRWVITEDCPNLLKEIRRYKRAQYATAKLREKNNKKEEPQKKDDHAIDSARYFFSFMPELAPATPAQSASVVTNLLGAPTRRRDQTIMIDPNLGKSFPQIQSHDEYIGEW